MSVGDVAHLVGYGNQSKFASAFRAVYGYPPLEYRRRMKNNASEQKKRFPE
ncbi:MAG: helix-turn-helix domain-containing protein [Lachnospiraceae bacterium]